MPALGGRDYVEANSPEFKHAIGVALVPKGEETVKNRKKTYEAPAVRRVGSFREVTGLLTRSIPDLLGFGNVL